MSDEKTQQVRYNSRSTRCSPCRDDVSGITRVYNTRRLEREPLVNSRRIRGARGREGEKRFECSNRGIEFVSHGHIYFEREDGQVRFTILIRSVENISRDLRKNRF